jgi:hypothetical protein
LTPGDPLTNSHENLSGYTNLDVDVDVDLDLDMVPDVVMVARVFLDD